MSKGELFKEQALQQVAYIIIITHQLCTLRYIHAELVNGTMTYIDT